MYLNGRHYTRSDLLDRVGDVTQLGAVVPATLSEGAAAGLRTLSVINPGGLSYCCLPDRGLDLGAADWRGTSMSWHSPVEDIAATFAERTGKGWLRTFSGGLLTTCGLTSVGQPGHDGDEVLGLHGRYSTIPARNVGWSVDWQGDDLIATIQGRVREVNALGTVIELRRSIRSVFGDGTLRIDDIVTNLGAVAAPHMFRYHLNYGFPLVDADTRIRVPAGVVAPRDDVSALYLETLDTVPPPSHPSPDRVVTIAVDGSAPDPRSGFINPPGRPNVSIRWSRDTLPFLIIWKQPSRRSYVTGLEPSNCDDAGRLAARQAGNLVELAPDEQQHHWLEISVEPSLPNIEEGATQHA